MLQMHFWIYWFISGWKFLKCPKNTFFAKMLWESMGEDLKSSGSHSSTIEIFNVIPVSKTWRSLSHPLSLLNPPKTYSFLPTAAMAAEDLDDGTWPPVTILFNVWESRQNKQKFHEMCVHFVCARMQGQYMEGLQGKLKGAFMYLSSFLLLSKRTKIRKIYICTEIRMHPLMQLR